MLNSPPQSSTAVHAYGWIYVIVSRYYMHGAACQHLAAWSGDYETINGEGIQLLHGERGEPSKSMSCSLVAEFLTVPGLEAIKNWVVVWPGNKATCRLLLTHVMSIVKICYIKTCKLAKLDLSAWITKFNSCCYVTSKHKHIYIWLYVTNPSILQRSKHDFWRPGNEIMSLVSRLVSNLIPRPHIGIVKVEGA